MPQLTSNPQEPTASKVLQKAYLPSLNFWKSDHILQHFVSATFSAEGAAYMEDKWNRLGQQAATRMDSLSQLADKIHPSSLSETNGEKPLMKFAFTLRMLP